MKTESDIVLNKTVSNVGVSLLFPLDATHASLPPFDGKITSSGGQFVTKIAKVFYFDRK